MTPPRHRALSAAAALGALVLAAGCTASSSAGRDSADGPVTLTVWHGWTQDREVNAFNALLAKFHAAHPNITVKAVPNVADDKLAQGVRGSDGPDVEVSTTTDNVGQFCQSGTWINLDPKLTEAGINPMTTFPAQVLSYTRFGGTQCALPLLGDAFGLYYNKDLFAKAGIAAPPKTMSELTRDAVKLQELNPDGSIKTAGYVPNFHFYESNPRDQLAQWRPNYLDKNGKSDLAAEPGVSDFLTWDRDTLRALGGYDKLEAFRTATGDEFSAQNAFETGKVAMELDGEWRIDNLTTDNVAMHWGVAPFPVPDNQAADYGIGYTSGTTIGISRASKHQAAAWELVKYLTTDTDAVTSFADAIKNVPTTFAALKASDLAQDPNFKTFLDIFANPRSTTTPASPNGGQYQSTLQNFCFDWESGKTDDLKGGLAKVDKQIDTDNAQAEQ
ncbi:extracellular solute-binding protein [Kitasatospora sp. NPDC057015]|uniref:extracellular solute-binding protein n=1 Tax=Kitasatospora sp. NPDC057015 TaxID=3346001 RepID=UPI00363E0AFE